MNLRTLITPILGLFVCLPVSAELISSRLTDVIKSNGLGDIDLFNPATPSRVIDGTVLEAFRQDNGGELVFAVDVNEAADGSEKASSQGVALDTVVLTLTINNQQVQFTQFYTQTKSLLARDKTTSRQVYFTLVGDSGSSRITNSTSSDINASSFDATINMPVDIDISSATAARLQVTFLVTNQQLGDPEAFYDYSNGYEDIALVTYADAQYLNTLEAGQDEAPLVLPATTTTDSQGSRIYYPNAGGYYIAAYEDRYPLKGDYDFNDLVVAYQVNAELNNNGLITRLHARGYMVTRGGEYNHDWYLHIPLAENISADYTLSLQSAADQIPLIQQTLTGTLFGSPDLKIFSDTRQSWVVAGSPFVNTLSVQSPIPGPRFELTITPVEPFAPSLLQSAPFDPYLFVHNTGYEIHSPGFTPRLSQSVNVANGQSSFTDSGNFPFTLIFNDTWNPPTEYTDLGLAYPQFLLHILSDRTLYTDWANSPAANSTVTIPAAVWAW